MYSELEFVPYNRMYPSRKVKLCNCTNSILIFILTVQLLQLACFGGLLYLVSEYGSEVKNKVIKDSDTITSTLINAKENLLNDSKSIVDNINTLTATLVSAKEDLLNDAKSIVDNINTITATLVSGKENLLDYSKSIVEDMDNIASVVVEISPCLEKICGIS